MNEGRRTFLRLMAVGAAAAAMPTLAFAALEEKPKPEAKLIGHVRETIHYDIINGDCCVRYDAMTHDGQHYGVNMRIKDIAEKDAMRDRALEVLFNDMSHNHVDLDKLVKLVPTQF